MDVLHSIWFQNVFFAVVCVVGLPLTLWKIWKDFRDNDFPVPHIFAIVFWASVILCLQIGNICGYTDTVDMRTAKIHYVVAGAILAMALSATTIMLGVASRKKHVHC